MTHRALRAVAPVLLAAPMLVFGAGTGGAADAADRFPPCADPGASGAARCVTALDNIADCHFRGGFVRGGEAPFEWSGRCEKGLAEGEGVLEDREGNRQTGRFSAGLRQGAWVLEQVDGTRREGPFGPGGEQGFWTIAIPNGERLSGRYEQGETVGIWTVEDPGGDVSRGEFREGMKHGIRPVRAVLRAGSAGLTLLADGPWLAWLPLDFGRRRYRTGFLARRSAGDPEPFRALEQAVRDAALGRTG